MFIQKQDILKFMDRLTKKHPMRLYPNSIKHVEDTTKTLSAKTIKNILNQATTVVKYALQNEIYKGENPFDFVIRPKVDNVRLKLMSEEEIETYLEALKPRSSSDFAAQNAYLFALLALTTGAREQTILNIKMEDIDFEQKIIHLYNFKTDTPYIGHIVSEEVELAIRETVKFNPKHCPYIFYNPRTDTKYSNYPKLARTLLESYVNKHRKESDKLSIKEFRNVFATRLINKGMNISHIQNLLNHKTPNMTSRYAQMLDKTGGDELKKMFEGVKL
jgi:site-specific recombinase XerD